VRPVEAKPRLIEDASDAGIILRTRRMMRKRSQTSIAEELGVDRSVVAEVEQGFNEALPLCSLLLVAHALHFDVELRPRELPFVPVPPVRFDELGLAGSTLAALTSIGAQAIEDGVRAEALLAQDESGEALYEVVCALNRHGKPIRGNLLPEPRELEMLRLRTIDGLTLKEVGERFRVGPERVRQILGAYFGAAGKPPAARGKGRRRAAHRD
jgi:transcriptional regulator with XRE-family HTH domain